MDHDGGGINFVVALIEGLQQSPVGNSTSSSSSSSSDSESLESECEDITESSSSNPSESDEDDDDDGLLFTIYQFLVLGTRRKHVEDFLQTVHTYTDAEFKEHFRLKRESAYLLIDQLDESRFLPTHTQGATKLTAELSFLMLLWYLGNTEPYRTIADRFDMSISSVFRVLRRVVKWLLLLQENKIRWPEGPEVLRISQEFENKRGIKGCIGAIDGSHIEIKQPLVDHEDYCNRKKWYSVILQAVVDATGKFTNVYCGDPGSLHDARVLRRSELFRVAEEHREIIFPNNTFLIGDSAYPSLSWLVPPFRDNGHLSAQQAEFNFLHSSTRMSVERAFGMLKGRFRRLKFMEFLDIDFVPKVIVACCVLHNVCLDTNDETTFDDYVEGNRRIHEVEGADYNRNQDRRLEVFHSLFG